MNAKLMYVLLIMISFTVFWQLDTFVQAVQWKRCNEAGFSCQVEGER